MKPNQEYGVGAKHIFLWLFIVASITTIFGSIAVSHVTPSEIKNVDCYDRLHNKVNGLSCEEINHPTANLFGYIGLSITLFFLFSWVYLEIRSMEDCF